MIRRLLTAVALLSFSVGASACFDFDAAYTEYCDAGHCTAGGGTTGGGTTGGGTGGGTTGGGGGTTGGGSATGGGGTTGGGTTGGGTTGGGTGGGASTCTEFFCPELDWKSSIASIQYYVAPGLYTTSFKQFFVYASFEADLPGSHNVTHWEYRFLDGGQPTTISRNSGFPDNVEARSLDGTSTTDLWYGYRISVQRRQGSATPVYFNSCVGLDGGMTDTWPYNFDLLGPDEAWFVGWESTPGGSGPSICHWTQGGGPTPLSTNDPNLWPDLRLQDVYRAPTGEVYAVGGVWNQSSGVATCAILREDGSRVSAPAIVDSWYDDGCVMVDGNLRGDVYVVARDDSNGHGHILQLQADGGFGDVYTAPYRLAALDVMASGEVWAVGRTGQTLIYFDGGAWGEIPLSLTENRPDVYLENVNALPEGVIVTGFETQLDGGNTAIVNTYRRFGH
ncbi:MAG: hypothetical protein U0228_30515 [Myxococcaceae bacterium]